MRHLSPGETILDPLAPYRSVDRTPRSGDGAPGCWVLANMVAGLDGSAASGGRVGGLSHGLDAELFRLMRAVADVVLVGAETVRREGYGPVRFDDAEHERRRSHGLTGVPPIAVVTRSLDLDLGAPLFTGADPASVIVTCGAAPADRLAAAREVADVVVAGDERVDVAQALAALAERFGTTVLCEGGPTLLGELVMTDLLDELCLTVSPVMGGDPLPVAVAPEDAGLTTWRLVQVAEADGTLFLRYERGGPGAPSGLPG